MANKMICVRCGRSLREVAHTTSMFNTDTICVDCKGKELLLPHYHEAAKREREEVAKGNYNFEGIGIISEELSPRENFELLKFKEHYCKQLNVYNSGGNIILAEMPIEYEGMDCVLVLDDEDTVSVYVNRCDIDDSPYYNALQVRAFDKNKEIPEGFLVYVKELMQEKCKFFKNRGVDYQKKCEAHLFENKLYSQLFGENKLSEKAKIEIQSLTVSELLSVLSESQLKDLYNIVKVTSIIPEIGDMLKKLGVAEDKLDTLTKGVVEEYICSNKKISVEEIINKTVENDAVKKLLASHDKKRFASAEEMLKCITSGTDLYCPEENIYVFLYNGEGSICVYGNISPVEAVELSKNEEYWGAYLGPGGLIYDSEDYYIFSSNQEEYRNALIKRKLNIHWCESMYDKRWIAV